MRSLLLVSLLSVGFALTACDSGNPVAAPSSGTPSRNLAEPMLPIEPGDGGGGGGGDTGDTGGGGGGGGGGTVTPPSPQFRLITTMGTDDRGFWLFQRRDVVAVARFQRLVNGSWQSYDAQKLHIDCSVDGNLKEEETETNASKLTLHFEQDPFRGYFVCNYSANDGAYTNTQSILFY